MSKKNELIEINNRIGSMTDEERTAYDLEQIKNKQRLAEAEQKAKAQSIKDKEIENKALAEREEQFKKAELSNTPKEFQDLYFELLKTGDQIRSYNLHGTIGKGGTIEKIPALKEKAEIIRQKMLSIVHNGYSIEFKPQLRYVSTTNPEHFIEQDIHGNWKTKGFEDIDSRATFEIDPKSKLPTKIMGKKLMNRLFPTGPITVPEEHLITIVTDKELEVKKAEELKKRKPRKIIKQKLPWSCTRCQRVNEHESKFCSQCGFEKQKYQ